MSNEINIKDFLGNKEAEGDNAIIDPNLKRSTDVAPSVDVDSLGLKKSEEAPRVKSDKEEGLDLIDKMVERKREEVARFNQALEENGGELTKEEWAKMNGEAGAMEYIAAHPSKLTEAANRKAQAAQAAQAQTKETVDNVATNVDSTDNDEDSELKSLEAEANEFDSSSEPSGNLGRVAETMASPKYASAVLGTPARVTNSTPAVENDDTDKVISDIEDELKALDGIGDGSNSKTEMSFEDKLKHEIEKKIIHNCSIPIEDFHIDTGHPVTADVAIKQSSGMEPTFKWMLYHTGVPFTMKRFVTNEIDTLSQLVTGSNNPSNTRKIYELIYNHIEDGKGENFEAWCRGVCNLDIQHLWMGVYGSCFQFSNFIPYECDSCKEIVIPDSIPIKDMVKYKNDGAKKRFDDIMSMESSDPEFGKTRGYTIKAVGRRIAVRVKIPTLYETIIEPAMLDNKFREKYEDVINLAESIEDMYFIDNGTLRRIVYKTDPTNPVKTLKFKILTWAKIIYSLNSDERGILYSVISAIAKDERVGDITYVEPAVICDKCGAQISESETTPSGMVFTRHQLAVFGALQ